MATDLSLQLMARRQPVSVRRRVSRYVRRAPGQLAMLLAGLVVLCLVTGVAGLLDVQHRRSVLSGVADRSSPLANAAISVYQSLSDADATATGVYLAGDQASGESRARYRRDITEAASGLSTAAAGAPDVETAAKVAQLTAELPMYTGLVDTAAANNRQKFAVGSAYLREASELVRKRMLPVAQQLYRDEMARLAVAQEDASSAPVVPLLLGGLTLVALLGAQLYLRRTTNRTLNAGLLVATAGVLGAVIWLAAAAAEAVAQNDSGRVDGSVQLEGLAEARITALTARSEEGLSLVARGSGQSYEDGFRVASDRLTGDGLGSLAAARGRISQPDTLDQVNKAAAVWQKWRSDHQSMREADARGDYNQAVLLATGVDSANKGPTGAPAPNTGQLSTDLDSELGKAVSQAQARLDEHAGTATRALDLADIAVIVLMILAAVGVAVGLAPRIREYR